MYLDISETVVNQKQIQLFSFCPNISKWKRVKVIFLPIAIEKVADFSDIF
jgi:hypothetical protein